MSSKQALIAVLSLLSLGFSAEEVSEVKLDRRLVHGKEHHSEPWVVFLKHPKEFCTGVLYKPNTVISTATCVQRYKNPLEWEAHLNRFNIQMNVIEKDSSVKKVMTIRSHYNFKDALSGYDVSVLKIDNNKQGPVVIIEEPRKWYKLSIVGWGSTNIKLPGQNVKEEDYKYPSKLLEINQYYLNNENCADSYKQYFKKDIMLCTYEKGNSSTCRGDKGSPLFYKRDNDEIVLYGISSFSKGCGAGKPDVHTKLNAPDIKRFINFYSYFFLQNDL